MTLHEFLDTGYGAGGVDELRRRLEAADLNEVSGPLGETPLHIATRRRRLDAVEALVDAGAPIDTTNGHGKTAYAHAARRGFDEVATFLGSRGASTRLGDADRLAVSLSNHRVDEARRLLVRSPGLARTGNPEEDRLLADMAGRPDTEPVELLIEFGADLDAPGLDGGTPLHQAAWFGQPRNAARLIAAGAPIDAFDPVHRCSPIGWAVHGARSSGGAEARREAYVDLVRQLLDAGARLRYPDDAGDNYLDWLRREAPEPIRAMLPTRS